MNEKTKRQRSYTDLEQASEAALQELLAAARTLDSSRTKIEALLAAKGVCAAIAKCRAAGLMEGK